MAKGGSYGAGRLGGVAMHEVAGEEGEDRHKKGDGRCCIAWDLDGQHLISCTSRSHLFFFTWPLPPSPSPSSARASPLSRLSHHRSALTALAASPSGRAIASASLDHSVKLYSYPEGEFQSNVTRFTLPIHSVAFSSTGSMLAAAGEDDGIKLISTIDSSIVRVFKGHNAPVVSLAFDPNNDFLASAGSDGTIMCWSLSSGKRVHTLYHAAPNIGLSTTSRNEVAWHPKGDVLAVPGRKNGVDVIMYDRDTGEKVFSLKGGHSAAVGSLAWSSNGKYLATAGGDNQVIIWDVDNRQDVDCQKFESQICSMAWKPKGNALAVIDSDGKLGVWDPVIPSHMTLPSDNSAAPSAIDREELLRFTDDEEQNASEDESARSSPDRDLDYVANVNQKNPKNRDIEHHDSHTRYDTSLKKTQVQPQIKQTSLAVADFPELQNAFQPGSTQPEPGKRHFLTYNVIGCITSFQSDGLHHVEVEFHDTGRGVRVPSMTDYFGFTMASMNERGCLFASPRKGDKNPSTILYRPFSSWASNSEWSLRLSGEEEATAVAVGHSWVAVSTSQNYLRLFSEGGLQIFITSLEGPTLTMVGHHDLLTVITHSSSPFPCGQPALNFIVLNVIEHTKVMEGRLPLSPGSHLTWMGFSETGILSSYDSKGILRVQSRQYGGCWIPVFSSSKVVKVEEAIVWMVGLNATQVMCIVCRLPDKQPQVSPKPVLSLHNLSLPLAHSDLGADELESELLLGNLQLAQITEDATLDEDKQEEEILKMKANIDRCILRLLASACKGDKLMKAVELTQKLTLDKSWKGAIKLVSAMKLPALAERLSVLYEEKMARESSASDGQLKCNDTSGLHLENHKSDMTAPTSNRVALNKQFEGSKGTEFLQPGRSRAPVVQKVAIESSQGETHENKGTRERSDANGEDPREPAQLDDAVTHGQSKARPCNPFAKSSSNPFAKSSPSGEPSGGSLLESLKRMRDTDVDVKGALKPTKYAKGS